MSSAAISRALAARPVSFHCNANCRLVKRPDVKSPVKNSSRGYVGYASMNTLTGSPKCAASRRLPESTSDTIDGAPKRGARSAWVKPFPP
jgi:hypothetical protein